MMKTMQTMELIETLFDETRNVINQRLDTLERQVNLILHHTSVQNMTTQDCCASSSCAHENKSNWSASRDNENEWMSHFNGLSQKLTGISNFLDQMNYRLKQLEEHSNSQSQKPQMHLRTPILGPQHLEGLLMVPEIKVTKDTDENTKNIIIQPNFVISDTGSTNDNTIQEFTDLQKDNESQQDEEEQEVEVTEEEVEEQEVEVAEEEVEEQEVEVAEEQEVEDEEQEVEVNEEEQEEEVVEDEALELEEFVYKNKKYFKDQFNKVYRQIDEETPEDEPFAEYDEKTKKMTRLSN